MKKCKICDINYKPISDRSRTCGSVKCKKENDLKNKYYKGNEASDTSGKLVRMKNRFLINGHKL